MGELQELFGEVRESLQNWWSGIRGRHAVEWDYTPLPEPENVVFTPLGPDGNTSEAAHHDAVCPITRQVLKPGDRIYQCRVCGLHYSPEGWQFLREVDKGRCCVCHCQNTILPMLKPR